MSLQLLSITDPRDNLDKARRTELVAYARANGVTNITEQMPAIIIRKTLRNLGLNRIRIPQRILGQPAVAARPPGSLADDGMPGTSAGEIDAADDLARQYEAEAPRNAHLMAYNEIRREAKKIGLAFTRKDNLASMKAKLAAAMQKGPASG